MLDENMITITMASGLRWQITYAWITGQVGIYLPDWDAWVFPGRSPEDQTGDLACLPREIEAEAYQILYAS